MSDEAETQLIELNNYLHGRYGSTQPYPWLEGSNADLDRLECFIAKYKGKSDDNVLVASVWKDKLSKAKPKGITHSF